MKCYYDKEVQTRLFMLSVELKPNAESVICKLSLLVQQCKQETKQQRSGYTKLLTIAKGELAAEALYYDAILNMEV
jgi:hypothetical protein